MLKNTYGKLLYSLRKDIKNKTLFDIVLKSVKFSLNKKLIMKYFNIQFRY